MKQILLFQWPEECLYSMIEVTIRLEFLLGVGEWLASLHFR